jgi:predicted CopG family antitoxin
MSSINISINEDVYKMLKGLKREDESFSEIIKSLISEKEISKCYGLLSDKKEDFEIIEKEASAARKGKWRRNI